MSKISELSDGGALLATDNLIVVRSGGNVRAQLSAISGQSVSATTLAASGATTLSSTLAVTGATTLSSTLAVTGAITGNVTGNLTGSVLTAAQPNITSLGSLTGLTVTGTSQITRLGLGVAAHADDALNITTTNQHIRMNNGSELGIINLDSDGKINIWAHGDGETINLKTGTGSGTDVFSVVGTNAGIGTSSPARVLEVASGAAAIVRITATDTTPGYAVNEYLNSNGGYAYVGSEGSTGGQLFIGTTAYATVVGNASAVPLQFATNNNVRATIDSSGATTFNGDISAVGIQANQDVSGTLGAISLYNARTDAAARNWAIQTNFNVYGDFVIRQSNAKDGNPITAGTDRLSINASGNLLVGCTAIPTGGASTGFAISENGGMQQHTHGVAGTTNTYVSIFRNANGLVGGIRVSGSQTFFDGSSDQRLKDNIVDAPSASEDIDAIQVRSFNWKADNEHQKYGMIAQELATVAPIAVYQPEDPEEMQAVDYSKLIPMLVKEIQSLRSRVAELENN